MTAVYCQPIKTSCSVDQDRNYTYTTVYNVRTNNQLDGPITVGAHPDLPRIGETYSVGNDSDTDAVCISGDIDRVPDDGTLLEWHVTAVHSTKVQSTRDNTTARGNPLSNGGQWKFSGSYIRGTKTVDKDTDGQVIMNSAREKKLYEIPYGHDTLVLDGNSANIRLSQRAQAIYRVNATTIWGLPAHALLLTTWNYEIMWHGDTPFVHNHLEFEISYDLDHDGEFIGWDVEMLDEGTRQYLGDDITTGKPKYWHMVDNRDNLIERDLLDGEGVQLETGDPPFYFPPKQLIREYTFQNLGLPTTLPGPFLP